MIQTRRFDSAACALMLERVLLLEDKDVAEVRVLGSKGAEWSGYFDNAADFLRETEKLTRNHANIDAFYVVLNKPDSRLLSRRANRMQHRPKETTSDADIVRRRWILVDIDVERPSGISASDGEREVSRSMGRDLYAYLIDSGLPAESLATMTSGNGFYVLVRVDLPNDPTSESLCKRFLQALATRFDTDQAHIDQKCFNASRIAALCGTIKGKGDSTPERPHRLVKPIKLPEFPVPAPLALLERIAGEAPVVSTARTANPASSEGLPPGASTSFQAPFDMLRFTVDNGVEVLDQKSSGGYERYYVTCPFDSSHTGTDAYLAVQPNGAPMFSCSHNSCRGHHWKELIERTGWKTPRALEREAQRRENLNASVRPATYTPVPVKVSKPSPNPAPDIHLWEKQLWQKSDEAIAALVSFNSPPRVFVKQGQLVRAGADADGRIFAQPLTLDSLRGILARCANWWTMSAKGNPKAATPPEDVIRDILSRPDLWEDIPRLDALAFAPVLTRSFELVTCPGYYPASRLLYHDADGLAVGDTTPTEANVQAALKLLLDDLLGDFPFKDQASRAHALALALLPIVRLAIVGPTPFHMVRASTPGTGKSLLVETLTSIVVPGGASASPCPGSDRDLDEEMRKRITTILMRGSGHVWLDNIKRHLDSPSLALALTQTTWSDRALGGNIEVNLPVRCVWVGTGNNPTLSDELYRRTIFITLDANLERPWDRDRFAIDDLKSYVAEHRSKLVGALLTLVRAWLDAGRPAFSGKRLGSFDGWSRVLGGILEAVGVKGFLDNREAGDQADPDRARWAAFLSRWHQERGEEPCGTGDVAFLAVEADIIAEESVKERQKLGYRLRTHLDRVFDNFRLELAPGDKHAKVARYRVVEATGLFREDNSAGTLRGLSSDLVKVPADTNPAFPSTDEQGAGTCGDLRDFPHTHGENTHNDFSRARPAETPLSPASPRKVEVEAVFLEGDGPQDPCGDFSDPGVKSPQSPAKPPHGSTSGTELIGPCHGAYNSGAMRLADPEQADLWSRLLDRSEALQKAQRGKDVRWEQTAEGQVVWAQMLAIARWWSTSAARGEERPGVESAALSPTERGAPRLSAAAPRMGSAIGRPDMPQGGA